DLITEVRKPSGCRLRFQYDTEGRLIAVENDAAEIYQYQYNATSQVTSEQDFAGRVLRFEHDLSGLCSKRVNGAGQETRLYRNAMGQLVRKVAPDGSITTFEYDENNRITSAKNSTIEVTFQRDGYGRVIREVQGHRVIESQFNRRGFRTKRITSTGHEVQWD